VTLCEAVTERSSKDYLNVTHPNFLDFFENSTIVVTRLDKTHTSRAITHRQKAAGNLFKKYENTHLATTAYYNKQIILNIKIKMKDELRYVSLAACPETVVALCA
jgi:hypothetical protein